MTNTHDITSRAAARQDFEKARRRAFMSELNSKVRGKTNRLIPFEEIRTELRQQNATYRGVQQIRVDKIIGSVGRYNDFTRQFLPLSDAMQGRWVNVQALTANQGWPPIELYKVGDAYFVRDGNHRTAIARQMGNATIEAHVWEFEANVELVSAEDVDDMLITLGVDKFEVRTKLSEIAPDHNIRFTAPGRYSELYVQIEDLREKIGRIDGNPISFIAAVPLWYDLIYLPTLQIIRDADLIDEFPGRTEADLFVWLSIHRHQLADRYGEYDNLVDLARELAVRYKQTGIGKVARQMRNLLGADEPSPLLDADDVSAADE